MLTRLEDLDLFFDLLLFASEFSHLAGEFGFGVGEFLLRELLPASEGHPEWGGAAATIF